MNTITLLLFCISPSVFLFARFRSSVYLQLDVRYSILKFNYKFGVSPHSHSHAFTFLHVFSSFEKYILNRYIDEWNQSIFVNKVFVFPNDEFM